MFDIYQVEGTPYCTSVHEHRAPTDESIKIYKEMAEKAHDAVIDTIKVDTNKFNGKVIISRDLLTRNVIAEYKFDLNGETFKGRLAEMDDDCRLFDRRELIGKLFRRAAEEIMTKMIDTDSVHAYLR